MPPIGLLLGGVDFADVFTVVKEGATPAPYASLEAAQAAGAVVMAWGALTNKNISFLIVAFCVFLFVKWANKAKKMAVAEQAVSGEAAAIPNQELLLAEIRDLL